jgi:hypothetical protein
MQAPGMRGFRDITADADDLGSAAAQANRAARKTYANVPSPSPEFDRLEPSMEVRGDEARRAPYSYDESIEEAEPYAPSAAAPRAPKTARVALYIILCVLVCLSSVGLWTLLGMAREGGFTFLSH